MRIAERVGTDRKSASVIPMPIAAPAAAPFVRRKLSPATGRALEMLGHAIEYLADEYSACAETKGPLGNADPRVEAIQILKGLNRALYYSGTEVPSAVSRLRRWFQTH